MKIKDDSKILCHDRLILRSVLNMEAIFNNNKKSIQIIC